MLGLVTLSLGQEVYGTWGRYRNFSVNTTAGGANVSATLLNYPLLVRLNATNFNFALAAGNGRDIRFAKNNSLPLKYQIESWDSAAQSANVWVLLDTVLGNSSNASRFRIYYGKAGAADSSNGAVVFSTANNFQGVFHLGETGLNDTIRDATSNKFKGIPQNRGGRNPADTAGLIGHAKSFLGNNTNNNGGSYRIATATGGNTFTNNALNFQNDSITNPSGIQYTISAWMNVSEYPSGTATRKGIISKSRGTNGQQFHMRLLDPAIDGIRTPGGDTMRIDFADGPTAVYKRGDHRLTPYVPLPYPPLTPVPPAWHYITAIRNGPSGTPANLKVIVDGSFSALSSTSTTVTTRSDFDVTIGSFSNDSGFFSGKLDEVRFENVARDSSWVKMNYETQKPGSLVVAFEAIVDPPPPPSGLTYRTNPLGLTATKTMVPDSVIAVTGTVTSYAVNPALPVGLSLNTSNGIISGTPTTVKAASNYIVTALGPGGTTTLTIPITINASSAILNNLSNVESGRMVFHLPEGMVSAQLSIADVWGRSMWSQATHGERELKWNGTGADGHSMTRGIYFARITMWDVNRNPTVVEKQIAYMP